MHECPNPRCRAYLAVPITQCAGGRCPRCKFKPGEVWHQARTEMDEGEKRLEQLEREERASYYSPPPYSPPPQPDPQPPPKESGESWWSIAFQAALAIAGIIFLVATGEPPKKKGRKR